MGELLLPELDRSAHDPMAEVGDPPPTRTRDLRHETIHGEPGKEAADLGTVARPIAAESDGGCRPLGAEIAIREAVDGILATHERAEELAVGPGPGIEGLGRAFSGGDGLEAAQPGRRILDLGQG